MGKYEELEAKRAGVMRRLNPRSRALPVTQAISELAPDLSGWLGAMVMGGVYSRTQVDLKTRALCNVAALTVMGKEPLLNVWVDMALNAGCTKEEIVEIISQMAFYGGVPSAVIAFNVAKQVFDERGV